MSAKHQSVTSLDDRVARMSDLRTLVDEVARLITVIDLRVTALEEQRGSAEPPELRLVPEPDNE